MIIALLTIAAIKVHAVPSPVIAVSFDGNTYTTYDNFSEGWNEAVGVNNTADTTVKLLADWTAQDDATYGTSFGTGAGFVDGQIYIPDTHRKFITLDLNGYTIDRHLTTSEKTGSVIVVGDSRGSSLIIKDTSTEKDGTTHINGDAENGKITGGNAGCINGTFHSNVTIRGGKFTGNTGDYLFHFEYFEMTGGEISGNICDMAVYVDGTNMRYVKVGGTAKVCNNIGSNLYIDEGGTISCMTGSNVLRAGANLCVTVAYIPSEYDARITDDTGANDYSQYFHSDSSEWIVINKTYVDEEMNNQNYTAFKAVTYTVNFNVNGHGTAPAPLTSVVTGHKITAPAEPSADSYNFEGWCEDEECINNWNFNTDTVTSNMVLYAKWSVINYDITYVLNGGTNALSNPDNYSVESADISLAAPEKQGCTFSGWTSDDIETPQLNVKINKGSYGIKTFTAHWISNTYVVTLEGNGGTGTNLTKYSYGKTTVLPTNYSKLGYTFAGWYDNQNLSGNELTEISSTELGEKKYYAKWIIKAYTITYDLNGGVNDSSNPINYNVESDDIDLALPFQAGYTFTGWTYDAVTKPQLNVTISKSSTGNRTFTANWVPNTYILILEDNGGTGTSLTSYTYGTTTVLPTDYTKPGYTFVGWYDNPEFTGRPITTLTSDKIGNLTLYANWVSKIDPDTGDKSHISFWIFIFLISSCIAATAISIKHKEG